jgi:hypothetical protein
MSDTDHTSGDDQLARLMAAAQAGDADAYTVLLEAVAPKVRQAVRRQRGFAGPQDVEDLVQDVLLSLHVPRTIAGARSCRGSWRLSGTDWAMVLAGTCGRLRTRWPWTISL